MTDIIDSFEKFEEIRKQYESMRSEAKNKLDDYRKKAYAAVDDFNRVAEMAGTDERLSFGSGDNASIDDKREFASVAELEAKDKEIASLKERIAKLESEEKDESDEDNKPEPTTAADKPKRRKARKAPEPIDVENIDFTGSDDDPSVVVQDSKHESTANMDTTDAAVQEKDETDSGEKQDDDIIDDKSTDVDDDEFMFL